MNIETRVYTAIAKTMAYSGRFYMERVMVAMCQDLGKRPEIKAIVRYLIEIKYLVPAAYTPSGETLYMAAA